MIGARLRLIRNAATLAARCQAPLLMPAKEAANFEKTWSWVGCASREESERFDSEGGKEAAGDWGPVARPQRPGAGRHRWAADNHLHSIELKQRFL